MQRKDFVPGVVFRLPKSNSIFKYEREDNMDSIREIGYRQDLHLKERPSLNLSVGNSSIQFYTGYGCSIFLMHSDKFKYQDIEQVSLDSLNPSTPIQNGNTN